MQDAGTGIRRVRTGDVVTGCGIHYTVYGMHTHAHIKYVHTHESIMYTIR